MRRLTTLAALAFSLSALVLAGTAHAQRKDRKATAAVCGINYLALAPGASWTYQPVNLAPGGPPAANLTLTVKSVEQLSGATVITLEETYRDETFTHEARCAAGGGLVVPPGSFLFGAEPGGGVSIQLEGVEKTGLSYPAGKLASGAQWFEELKADVSRPAADGSGADHPVAKLEMERLATVRGTETISGPMGSYRATLIAFEIRGRATIGETSQEIPVRQEGGLWIAPDVGIVRAREISGREWELVNTGPSAEPAP